MFEKIIKYVENICWLFEYVSLVFKKTTKGMFYLSNASSVFRIEYKKLVACI